MSAALERSRDWVVTGADGLDELLKAELTALGASDIRGLAGAVAVRGPLALGYRICLWSRLASRVLLPLFSVSSGDPDRLYQAALKEPWEQILAPHATFAVRAAIAKGVRTHSRYAALRLKDAIVDRFRQRSGQRPSVDADQPDLTLHVYIEAERIQVSLDFSGDSLHKRGYRVAQGGAPLKENLAAAQLLMADWPARGDGHLVDPLCGSGTLLIEAAMLWADAAPGLGRNRFGFDGWAGHQQALWEGLRAEAVARRQAGLERPAPLLLGLDADAQALRAAERNVRASGFASWISLHQASVAQWSSLSLWPKSATGLVVSNPPYGERLSEEIGIRELYRAIGRQLRGVLPGWEAVLLAADITHADALGLAHRQTLRLFNGALPIFARHGLVLPAEAEPALSFEGSTDGLPEAVLPFANRLQKNLRASLRQAADEDVRCFRLYDADLPEFNLAVDVYDTRLHVQEYAPPKTVDADKAAERFRLALLAIRHVLGVHRDRVFIKVRERQSGNAQYTRQGKGGKFFEVREGQARLLVNLTDYLDTGLFLDHRPMRLRLAAEAAGKHFLNLFAYTGTATVHAALGGAATTTTVDLSPTYLTWAGRNLALNGLPDTRHRLVQADVMTWLRGEADDYELIFVDPPTFSNSKRTDDVFDVQRDHVALLDLAMARLTPDGCLYFSNNFRKFQLDPVLESRYEVEDISTDTIGFDFQRNARIHRCWRLRHPVSS